MAFLMMRKKLFKWHSYAALIALIPLFIMSITGSILVFKVEIDNWLMPEKMQVFKSQHERLSLDELMSDVKHYYPHYEIGSWELFDSEENEVRSDTAYLIKHGTTDWYKVYVDQYRGEILSNAVGVSDNVTDWLVDLHFRLLLDTAGIFIGAIVSLLFIFLSISGIILYRKFWLKFFTLRFKQAKRIFFSDLHKMVGIASSPVLLILGITGAYWNIAETIHEVSEHVIEEPYLISAPLYNQTLSIEGLYQQTKNEIDSFNATYLLMPFEPNINITFFGAVETHNPLNSEYSSTITYDKVSGEVLHKEDVRTASNVHVVVDSFRKLHFGYFAGIWSQLIWCLFGLSPVILSITGFYLYLQHHHRKPKWLFKYTKQG